MINTKKCFVFVVAVNIIFIPNFSFGMSPTDVNKHREEVSWLRATACWAWHMAQPITGGVAFGWYAGSQIGNLCGVDPENKTKVAAVFALGGAVWFGGSQMRYDFRLRLTRRKVRRRERTKNRMKHYGDALRAVFSTERHSERNWKLEVVFSDESDIQMKNAIEQLVAGEQDPGSLDIIEKYVLAAEQKREDAADEEHE